jgi:hypothetical protein
LSIVGDFEMSNTDLHSNTSKELEVDTPAVPFEKDVEASKEPEVAEEPVNTRAHIPRWQWWLTLTGLYLGALLYGL